MNISELKLEDLTNNHRDIADTIGLNAFISLCESMGGTCIIVPSHKWLRRNYTKRQILENRNSYSVKQLSKIYDCSESSVYNILKVSNFEYPKNAPKEFYMGDLDQRLQVVAEIIGFEKCLELCHVYESQQLYIPTIKELSKGYVERKIIEEHELFLKEELAQMYGVSISTVYNILKRWGK